MIHQLDEPIAAIASPPGAAARGIIRLSGPTIDQCLSRCVELENDSEFASFGKPSLLPAVFQAGNPIGAFHVEILYWPTTASYTRQRSAEIHTVGSPVILQSMLDRLGECGVRQAQPGEFTFRAFAAGRIDLTRAEAVLGVVDAGSRRELALSLRQLSGGISEPLDELRESLLDVLSRIEAGLDFVEEDIEFISIAEISEELGRATTSISRLIEQLDRRGIQRGHYRIAIIGRPNAGKSSLLNRLTGEKLAIVSDQPGTTRDFVSGMLPVDDVKIEVFDTAGYDPFVGASAQIDQMAEAVARQIREQSHLRLVCIDGQQANEQWSAANESGLVDADTIAVMTKADLNKDGIDPNTVLCVSSLTGQGIAQLRSSIVSRVLEIEQDSAIQASAVRCRESLGNALENLRLAEQAASVPAGEDIVASQIRNSLDALAIVTGRVYTDDILDRIFSKFCIGK